MIQIIIVILWEKNKFRNFLAEDPNGVELEFVKRD